MKKTKRPTEQELLHQWLEGDLDLTQQLYVEKDEPQPEAVEPYQPKRDRDTFLRSLRRSLRLYNVLAFLLCAVFAALMLMTVANLPRYGSADAPTVNEVAQRYVEQGTEETGAVNTVAGMILDYRAFDTLGESFVLFTAVCAVTILMNLSPKKRRPLPKEVVNYAGDPAVRRIHPSQRPSLPRRRLLRRSGAGGGSDDLCAGMGRRGRLPHLPGLHSPGGGGVLSGLLLSGQELLLLHRRQPSALHHLARHAGEHSLRWSDPAAERGGGTGGVLHHV